MFDKITNGSNFGKRVLSRRLKSLKFYQAGYRILTLYDGESNFKHAGRNGKSNG
ncbi:hypothetical protein HanRHA438_Chr14g0650131 [Helianthus annuus]|uniref:Uncharacterized protein n=1 Tax=Helianthus annuus TaxID=4232 RepID=A0A9K3EA06_HELAN|nr:hypothetical protein HanXRQr2_Chr14g0639681 [Helianthus annuus]KAJ0463896.1 hypothetical protein HanHA300_Chr14g0520871 [Helianthus annuus]KAJ0524690.1 hypothetical protein HanHA300_Chr09g0303431 [Helianthus annuus]KAJ0659625.1 hypothetical protein HanOQP8_Chr14g0528301 [Helianthus annuus]KAJ0716229.1 hypothetical protein HanPI659440_Chr13g0510371 [Helianthus annuus]